MLGREPREVRFDRLSGLGRDRGMLRPDAIRSRRRRGGRSDDEQQEENERWLDEGHHLTDESTEHARTVWLDAGCLTPGEVVVAEIPRDRKRKPRHETDDRA